MNTKPVLALSALLLSALGTAQAADGGYELYRRAVLGDISVSAPAVQASRQAYGPYALVRLQAGVDGRIALAEARAIGEAAPALRLHTAQARLGGYELYRRAVLGEPQQRPAVAPVVVGTAR
jgi:hypothetical protein